MFDPEAKKEIDKKKLSISGQCSSFKECKQNKTISTYAKWTILKCGSLLHFDQNSQECIDQKFSTCGNYKYSSFRCIFIIY